MGEYPENRVRQEIPTNMRAALTERFVGSFALSGSQVAPETHAYPHTHVSVQPSQQEITQKLGRSEV